MKEDEQQHHHHQQQHQLNQEMPINHFIFNSSLCAILPNFYSSRVHTQLILVRFVFLPPPPPPPPYQPQDPSFPPNQRTE